MADFRNATALEFSDLSSEVERTYTFPKGKVTIKQPLKLNVSPSGGHRVFDADGTSHYIPAGWMQLSWKVRDGAPHFDF